MTPAGRTPPRRPGTRALLLASLLVLVPGAAAGLTAPHWPGVAGPTGPADATGTPAPTPSPAPDAPASPAGLGLTLLLPAGEIDAAARARVTWSHPGPGGEEHVELRWHELPENYAAHAGTHPVHGRRSAVLTVPLGLARVCVEARTLREDGTASAPEVACLPTEAT